MREFENLAAFALHLATVEATIVREGRKALDKAAKLIEDDAKEKLGYYQGSSGPYPAWEPLADSTLAKHAALGVGDSPLVLTGELYGSISRTVHNDEALIGSPLDKAVVQEFGTDHIPPRPFLGPAAWENTGKIQELFARAGVDGFMGGNVIRWPNVEGK